MFRREAKINTAELLTLKEYQLTFIKTEHMYCYSFCSDTNAVNMYQSYSVQTPAVAAIDFGTTCTGKILSDTVKLV